MKKTEDEEKQRTTEERKNVTAVKSWFVTMNTLITGTISLTTEMQLLEQTHTPLFSSTLTVCSLRLHLFND